MALIYKEGEGFRTAPIFDNGLSLLSDTNEYMLGTSVVPNIRRIKSKPFGAEFVEQMNILGEGFKIYGDKLDNFLKINRKELGRIYDIIKYSIFEYDYLII